MDACLNLLSSEQILELHGMKTADCVVVLISLIVMLVIAIISAVRMRSPDEYFTAGRRIRRFLLIMFAFGSGTSSDSQASVMAGTWRAGLAGLWWQFLWLPITPIYWIIAPLLRRLRAITTADFFAMRFGSSTAALYSIYGMVISVVLMAGVLFGGAKLLNALTDPFFSDVAAWMKLEIPVIDLTVAFQPPSIDRPSAVTWKPVGSEHAAACCLSVVIVIATVIGGLGSTIWIDALQGTLRIGLTIVLLPIMFRRIGGFGMMHTMESLKPGMLDFVANSNANVEVGQEPFTPFYLCMLSIAALTGIIVQPHIITMCGAARTEMDSRIGFTFGNLLKRCMSVAWAFIGLACLVWYLGPSSPLQTPDAPAGQKELFSRLTMVAKGEVTSLPDDQKNAVIASDSAFADRVFGRVVRDVFGGMTPGLMGMIVALVFASVIAHCGTQMIAGSGLFAEHLYRHHIAPGHEASHYLAVGRLCGPLLVLVALLLQTTFTDVTDALKLVIKTPAVIGISMWMGLVWTRWNTVAVWATTISAALLGIICGYYPEEIQKTIPALADQMFLNGSAGLVMVDAWKIVCILLGGLFCGVVASFLTEPQHEDQLERFYRVIRSRVMPDENQYADQYTPPEDCELASAVSFLGFQFPGPTKSGTIGFVLVWLVVIALVLGTKWLSLQL